MLIIKRILSILLALLMTLPIIGCTDTKKYEADYADLFSQINEVSELPEGITPTILSLWSEVGPDYISGVLQLMTIAEDAADLEDPIYSNTKYPQLKLPNGRITFKGAKGVDNYYDILAVTLGYGCSYSTFRAGSSIPHDQTVKMWEIVEVYQTIYKAIKEKKETITSSMKEFRSKYKDKHAEEVSYLYDFYSETVAYADAVLDPSGSYNSFSNSISEYRNKLSKLRTTADLYGG